MIYETTYVVEYEDPDYVIVESDISNSGSYIDLDVSRSSICETPVETRDQISIIERMHINWILPLEDYESR